jgi:hypothetical protein
MEIVENDFPFPPEFGRPKASIFRSRAVPGRLDALLAKSLFQDKSSIIRYCVLEYKYHVVVICVFPLRLRFTV